MPSRQVLANRLEHFVRFFDEDFEQLIIDGFFVGRRRQQARWDVARGRIDSLDRCGHDVFHTHGGLSRYRSLNALRQYNLGHVQRGHLSLVPSQWMVVRKVIGRCRRR